ncbi:hypothetical protein PS723_00409 [Pseudomonas fluorescens]|uniref:Uncharacterized protein n=1 Tax=Pseudomonas fluorescens TaxID=294 RepID=A0A5E6ZWZ6_PSEFL|nr:hypothetical protein PS723_00409 [Pseudomonas fluorescens]
MTIVIIARTAVMVAAVASIPDGFPGMVATLPLANTIPGGATGMTSATAITATVTTPITAAIATTVATTTTTTTTTTATTVAGLSRGDER